MNFWRGQEQNWPVTTGIQMPQLPTVTPGEDLMSQTIAGVLPTLGAPLEANMAALQGKETMFSGKVAASNVAYQGSEDSGEQGVMQVVQMLGQLGGQAGQMAGAPAQMAGQIPGSFSSLMQPMMQAFQGAGHGGGEHAFGGQGPDSGGTGAGQGPGGMAGAQQQERDDAKAPAQAQAGPQQDRDRDDHAAAGPQAGPGDKLQSLSPVPELPPEHAHRDDGEDLARRL
jgi:hypothetical protein